MLLKLKHVKNENISNTDLRPDMNDSQTDHSKLGL